MNPLVCSLKIPTALVHPLSLLFDQLLQELQSSQEFAGCCQMTARGLRIFNKHPLKQGPIDRQNFGSLDSKK